MEIAFCRIDDRLIHGQVATVWTKVTGCNRIMCCNDDVAQDTLRKKLLLQVAPPGIKAYVIPVEKAVAAYKNPKYAPFKTLFLFTNPRDVVRAVKGGIGAAKTGGNYASSLKATFDAAARGFDQVLWLDGRENKYVEEVGAMNMMFVIDGKIVTAPLEGSILAGVTRKSILQLAQDMGYETEERRISVQELFDAHARGTLTEAFGTGTAAVISPVGEMEYDGRSMILNDRKIGKPWLRQQLLPGMENVIVRQVMLILNVSAMVLVRISDGNNAKFFRQRLHDIGVSRTMIKWINALLYSFLIDIFNHFNAKFFRSSVTELNHFFKFPCRVYVQKRKWRFLRIKSFHCQM